jgi:hypothetical protein
MNTHLPLLVLSHHGGVPGPFQRFVREGRLAAEWEWDLSAVRIAESCGVMLTLHLDQIRATDLRRCWRVGGACCSTAMPSGRSCRASGNSSSAESSAII